MKFTPQKLEGWGYRIVQESLANAVTPGKRACDSRVCMN